MKQRSVRSVKASPTTEAPEKQVADDPFKRPEFLRRYEGRHPLEVVAEDLEEFVFSISELEEKFRGDAWGMEYIKKSLKVDSEKISARLSTITDQIRDALPKEKQRLLIELESATAENWVGEMRIGQAVAFVFGMKLAGASMEEIRKHVKVWRI